MNLVDQLGGYENAKERGKRENVLNERDFNYIQKALLEYRRENNIYEVGDKIVSTIDGDEDWKSVVRVIYKINKDGMVTTGFKCELKRNEYRHAEANEIKLGWRI